MNERILIVESTLREGEQFAGAHFTPADKQEIARALDRLGVPYIEISSPAASARAFDDARLLAGLGLRARLLAHVRCVPADVRRALDAGVDGVNLYFGLSPLLRAHSHRRDVEGIITAATECVGIVRAAGREARFGCEDAFRTPEADLLRVCTALDEAGVVRLSLADTVGLATPRRVDELVRLVRRNVRADIEFHGHDDSGCAVANAHAAVEAGARFVDTSVLGLGERNGITGLGALLARLYASDPAFVQDYDLARIRELDVMVAAMAGVPVPFNTVVSGANAFSHAAGAHTAAVLRDPHTYEALDPAVFGATRTLHVGHHLTGRHAVAGRAAALGLALDGAALEQATVAVKDAAGDGPLDDAAIDGIVMAYGSPHPQPLSLCAGEGSQSPHPQPRASLRTGPSAAADGPAGLSLTAGEGGSLDVSYSNRPSPLENQTEQVHAVVSTGQRSEPPPSRRHTVVCKRFDITRRFVNSGRAAGQRSEPRRLAALPSEHDQRISLDTPLIPKEAPTMTTTDSTPEQPQTLAEKILSHASGQTAMAGDLVVVDVDMTMSHDSLAKSVFDAMQAMGATRVHDPARVALFVDHVAPASSVQVAEAQAMLRRFARDQGVANFFDAGRGICHQVMIEQRLVRPGTVAVGADSHSTLYGCVGVFGTGMGSTDVAVAMATGQTWLRVPTTIRIELTGELPPGVGAKDATLQLAGRLGAAGARYMAVEYVVPATLDLPARMTLCGMTTELGAKAGIIVPDAVTRDYAPVPEWLYPDPGATYARREMVDLSALEPLVAEPGHVDRVTPVSAAGDVPVDVVFIGTCTNGRLADLHAAADVLRGHKIHPGTRLMVVPASHDTLSAAAADGTLGVLLEAGATLGTPGCGPCMGRHQGALAAGEVCLSTGNRNFAGRMGSAQAQIYLGSPAVAAATAVAGRLAAPADVL